MSSTDESPTAPRIEVIGDASPEQVAALVAVLSAAGGGQDEGPSGPASRWASRERLVRAPLHPAPGAWRAAAFPR
ncbi:acyl-CoA carboxylase epsilon subunit [Janibacter alittae]|uniref:Acyl-CoA carboxylase epsilon subunit n=1 Tax=Janibacter alittae TaxID=3115209 RepID=A0ABZ2MEV1_9MICO